MGRIRSISIYLVPFLCRTPYEYTPAEVVCNTINGSVKISAKGSDKKGNSLQIRRYKTR